MTDIKSGGEGTHTARRMRKYWLGCNWKCNGSIEFIKDSVKNMFNDVKYNKEHMGKTTFNKLI